LLEEKKGKSLISVRGWMEQAVTKEIRVIQDAGISNEVEIKFIPKTFPTKSRQYCALFLLVGEDLNLAACFALFSEPSVNYLISLRLIITYYFFWASYDHVPCRHLIMVLFNDADSIIYYISPNGRMIMNNKLGSICKESVFP
jgi:hypothetical protein